MPGKKWTDVSELGERYADWLMDKIEAKSNKEQIRRREMSMAAIYVGVTGLVGDGSTPEDWDRLAEVATDLVEEVLALIDRRMSDLKQSELGDR